MKMLLSLAALTLAATAHAGTLLRLPLPPTLLTVGQSGTKSCAGVGFNADGSVHGSCHTKVASACSGRGCQPLTMITTYAVLWDAEANVVSEVTCSVTRHHLPQTDTTTYAPGFDATRCPAVNLFGTGTSVVINGTPYYYVTTDAASGAELVNSNSWGFLYLP
jgi:hypothetical protein